jgi:hypothetical protein
MTAQTLQVLRLRAGEYVGALKHAAIGSAVMVGVVTLVQRELLANVPPLYHVVITSTLGVLVYSAYQGVFNRQALHEMKTTLKPAPRPGPSVFTGSKAPMSTDGTLSMPFPAGPDAVSIGVKGE